MAAASGWTDKCSRLVANERSRGTVPLKRSISATTVLPSVIVPVLSNSIVESLLHLSNDSPFLIRKLSSAPLPTPTVTAVGVARPRAHGHATTRTAINVCNAN